MSQDGTGTDDEPVGRLSPTKGAQALGAGVAAVAGLTPLGPIVSAAVTPFAIAYADKVLTEIRGRSSHSVAMLLAHAASRLEVDPDEVQPRAYTTAAGEALFVDSVTAAAETIDQRKIAALAMALAAGLAEDRSRIDEERLVVRALAQLEAPQIRILAAVSSGQFPEPTASPGRGVAGARRVATPPPKRPATRTQRAILATLQAQGLVVDDTREMAKRADAETVDRVMSVLKHMAKVQDARDGGLPSPSLPVTPSDVERFRRRQAEQDQLQPDWRRTPFGDQCLAYLWTAAEEAGLAVDDLGRRRRR